MKLRKDGTQAVGRLESDGLANRLRMAAGRMGQLQKDSLLPRLPGLPRLPARNIDRVTTGRTLGTERVGKTGPRTGAKTGAPSPARAQSGGENAGERERTSPFSRVPEWEKEAGKKATALFDEHGRYRGNASAGREKAVDGSGPQSTLFERLGAAFEQAAQMPEWEKEAGKKATALFDGHGDYIPTKEREEARRARQQADTREMALGAPIREEELPLIDEYTGAPPAYDVNQKEAFALYNEWVRYEANVERLKRIAGYGGHLVGDISNEIRKAEEMAELAWRDYASVPINLTEETLRNSYARQYASLLSKRALITDLDRERVDMAVKALDRVIDSKWSTNEQKAQAREVRNTLYHKTTKAARESAILEGVTGLPIEVLDPTFLMIDTSENSNPQLLYMKDTDMMKMNYGSIFGTVEALQDFCDAVSMSFGSFNLRSINASFWEKKAKDVSKALYKWALENAANNSKEHALHPAE